jgi:hypothetical protein
MGGARARVPVRSLPAGAGVVRAWLLVRRVTERRTPSLRQERGGFGAACRNRTDDLFITSE